MSGEPLDGATPAPPCTGERRDGPIVAADTPRTAALAALRRAFVAAGLDAPALEARLLLLAALGIAPADLIARPDAPVDEAAADRLASFARRRLACEPVARILGEREFWGLPFVLSSETLVPRPDTETVIETALGLFPDGQAPLRLLDLGTGSGCLLIALLYERPRASGIGIDRSCGALATARRNAQRNGVAGRALFAASDWAAALRGPFDLIVSNPPYIPSPVVPTLAAEVRDHDPRLALDGGEDGLDAYRIILADARRLLGPRGRLIVEIGYDQAEDLRQLAAGFNLDVSTVAHDLSGNPRCVVLKRA
jgi:release factor glutamine methyltransferase